jgi:hypothetical protein
MREIKPFMSLDVMKMIYYSYFHSVISYVIILGVILNSVAAFLK